ncbi:dnaJ subfamily C member 4 [Caerostris extrusa]|uniref:DnaJ subfamily C member 4 n=1 Tax=Caerostris extrusa TaxID=172846 RepID=A0AAV4UWN3_CAEEX|nr:dnaJ subfamily C member 4 [Caerostris extrusa]
MQFKGFLLPSRKIADIWVHAFNICTVNSRFYCNKSSSRNPYEVLGLKTTCSTKDVKKAYIKLCKELHPDMKPGDASQHQKFVDLNKAYITLVNAENRKQFDNKTDNSSPRYAYRTVYKKASGPFDQGHWQTEEAWYEKDDYQQYYHRQRNSNPAKPLSNKWIVFGCFLLVIIGSILYFSAYSFATNYTLSKTDEKSRKISENYQDTRKRALDNGKEEQLERLKKRWNI